MNKAKKRKTTTISCDESVRKYVADEAKRKNRTQREVLANMIDVYKRQAKKQAGALKHANEFMAAIDKKLDKAIKRDDVVISFIKEHEKEYGNPTLDRVKQCETLLSQLVSILQQL